MRKLLLAWIFVLVSGCAGAPTSSPAASPSSRASATPVASSSAVAITVPGGCGSTAVVQGGIPAWLDEAGSHNNPSFLPYAVASPPQAAGFIFGYPLRAGAPEDPANKILWVVGQPRNGSPLVIAAHPVSAASPSVTQTFPDNASPGEIYPSIFNVPMAGCWHLDLSWSGHKASVELLYQ
jgi:hypothetical protein